MAAIQSSILSGTLVANPVYLVDASGNPITSSNATNVTVTNANANGQTTMANSTPVVLPSDQMIDLGLINAIRTGKGFIGTTTKFATSTNANLVMGMSLFNPSNSGKNIFVYGARQYIFAGTTAAQMNKTTTDPALATTITPLNTAFGNATTSVASVTSAANNATASISVTGTELDHAFILSEGNFEFIPTGSGILLANGTASGILLFHTVATAANVWQQTMRWIEF